MSEYLVKKQRGSDDLQNIDRRHQRNMKTARQKQKQEVQEMRDKGTVEKQVLKQNQHAAINHIKTNHSKLERQEMFRHKAYMEDLKYQQTDDMQRRRSQQREAGQTLRFEGQKQKRDLEISKNAYKEKKAHALKIHEERLGQLKRHNRFLVKKEREQNREMQRDVRESHTGEISRLVNESEANLDYQSRQHRRHEGDQRQAHLHELRSNEDEYQTMRKRRNDQHRDKFKEEKLFYQGQVLKQDERFEDNYKQNIRANKEALIGQKKRYAGALFDLKSEFQHRLEFYERRKDDPFYKLLNLDAKFTEGPGHYEITAQVPEHEMEHVKVRVQKDKMAIFGTRMHNQEYIKDNAKMGSSNAQTVRKEFSLLHPADPDQVVQTYKDGLLTVTVPKLGYIPTVLPEE